MTTTYRGHEVHIVHVTDITQHIDGHDITSTMAKIYFTDEDAEDAYYVPADEVEGLPQANPYTKIVADKITDELLLAIAYSGHAAIAEAAITELRTRPDYTAMVEAAHAEAAELFDQAKTDEGNYRLARTGPDSVQHVEPLALGAMLERRELNRWAAAVVRDELHARALRVEDADQAVRTFYGQATDGELQDRLRTYSLYDAEDLQVDVWAWHRRLRLIRAELARRGVTA